MCVGGGTSTSGRASVVAVGQAHAAPAITTPSPSLSLSKAYLLGLQGATDVSFKEQLTS